MTEVFLFPGQGSQRQGMGREEFARHPELTEQATEVLGWPVAEVCLANPGGVLDDTRYTQPCVYLVNALAYRAMGRTPDVALGHSLGEFNALEAAGVLDIMDGLRLVARRAALTAAVPGAMTAVLGLSAARVLEVLDTEGLHEVTLANHNTPRQAVLAGPSAGIERAEAALREAGAIDIRRLAVSGPFHSPHMAAVVDDWAAALPTVDFRVPRFPVVANHTARPYQAGDFARILAAHIHQPVRWHESIRWVVENHPDVRFTEVGERGLLVRMLRQISPEHARTAVISAAAMEHT
jgi:malonyl CoA-acyl carrier protein transacylase